MKIILHASALTLIILLIIVNPVHAARLQTARNLTRLYPHAQNTKFFSSSIPKLPNSMPKRPTSTKKYTQELKKEGEKALAYALSSMSNANKNPCLAKQFYIFNTMIADHQKKLRTPFSSLIIHPTLSLVIKKAKRDVCKKKNIDPHNIFITAEPINDHSTTPAKGDTSYSLAPYYKELFSNESYNYATLFPPHPPYAVILDPHLLPYFEKYPDAIKALLLIKITDMHEGYCLIRDVLTNNIDLNARRELQVRQARIANLLPALNNKEDATLIHNYFVYHYHQMKNHMTNNTANNVNKSLNPDFMHQHPYKTAEEVWLIKKMHEYSDLNLNKKTSAKKTKKDAD